MAKGINIPIASDTREFAQGVKRGVIDPLEDAGDTLDDIAKSGDKAGDELEDAFKRAQQETSDFKRDQRDVFRDLTRQSKRATDDVGDNARRGFGRAEDAAEAFQDEAKQNFAETASSFDGSMESIADMAQSTLGGLATSISGPLGLALAGLGAAGGAFAASWLQATEDTKERVRSMYEDMLESGQNYLSQDFIQRQLQELIEDEETMNKLRSIANQTGLEMNTIIRAQLSAGRERTEVQDALNAKLREARDTEFEHSRQQEGVVIALTSSLQHMTSLVDEEARAVDMAEQYRDVLVGIERSDRQRAEAADKQGERLQRQADILKDLPKEVTTKVKLDTSHLDRELAKPRSLDVRINGLDRYGRRVF